MPVEILMEIDMNKIMLVLIMIPIVYLHSQVKEIESRSYFKQGDFEVNFSTNLGVGFQSVESSNSTDYNPYYYQDGDRPFIFLISAAVGVCVIDGFSVEPEFDINLITDAEVSTSILANVIYNFNIPRKKIYPFIKLGYGFSNYKTDYYYNSNGDNSLDTGVLNLGAGIKSVYSSGMALKLEINYKRYSYSNTYNDYYNQYSYEIDALIEALSLSIGYSILF
jgi:hypothetical protein